MNHWMSSISIGKVIATVVMSIVLGFSTPGCDEKRDQQNVTIEDGGTLPLKRINPVALETELLGTVDGVEIPLDEFNRRYRAAMPSLKGSQGGRTIETAIRLKRNLVRALIDEMLLETEAKRRKIQVTEEEIEKAVQTFSADFEDPAAFQNYLSKRIGGLAALRNEKRLSIMRARLVGEPAPVTDADIATFYERNIHRFKRPAHLLADKIVFLKKEGRDAVAELVALKKRIVEEGLSFRHQARRHSEVRSPKSGFDMGRVTADSVKPEIWNAVKSLKPLQISAPIEFEDRVILVQARDWMDAVETSMDDAKEDIRRAIEVRRQSALEGALISDLRAKAKIQNEFETRYQTLGGPESPPSNMTKEGSVNMEAVLDKDLKQAGPSRRTPSGK